MIPIALNGSRKFDENDFLQHLMSLCKGHKEQQRALAFAFIVYDFEDYTINKILKDQDYWNSLDRISGRYLSVFYINSQNSYYKRRQQQIYNEERRRQSSNEGYSYMVPLKLKPTPLDNAVGFIKKELDLDDVKHPFILFFQTDGDYISDYLVVNLKQEKLEDAFLELRDHIKSAVDSLLKVREEYFKNHREIFNLVKGGVKSGQFYSFVNKKVAPKIPFGAIISFLKFIAGSGG